VFINITLFQTPCHLLTIICKDELGKFTYDVNEGLERYKVSKHGEVLERIRYEPAAMAKWNIDKHKDDIIKQLREENGCRIEGNFRIGSVPGTIMVSYFGSGPMLEHAESVDPKLADRISAEHYLNGLSFGKREVHSKIRAEYHCALTDKI